MFKSLLPGLSMIACWMLGLYLLNASWETLVLSVLTSMVLKLLDDDDNDLLIYKGEKLVFQYFRRPLLSKIFN